MQNIPPTQVSIVTEDSFNTTSEEMMNYDTMKKKMVMKFSPSQNKNHHDEANGGHQRGYFNYGVTPLVQ